MARALVLKFKDTDYSFFTEKVDRSKLYGFIDVEALDAKGRKCTLVTLADDGCTLVGSGGSAFASLDPDGNWLEKSSLKPVDIEGKPLTPVPSSYAAPTPLTKTVSIEEYLSHNIKGVYLMSCETDLGPLLAELKKGIIYSFPYSFRGGLEADVGFLLTSGDGSVFMAVGQPTNLHFVGLEQTAALTEETAEGEEEESMDFGMM
jgi:hypothetical protein